MEFEENEMQRAGEAPPVAIVYLQRADDPQNKISLTEDALIVVKGGRRQVFALKEVQTLDFHKRVLLLPLVAGGVLLPFGIAAMFGNFLNPYFVVLLVLAGMYLLYEGLNSRWALTVSCRGASTDIPLESPTQNIRAFAEFVNGRLRGRTDAARGHIYTVIADELYHRSDGERFIDPGSSRLRAYTERQWMDLQADVAKGQCALRLDPTHNLLRVEFARDEKDGILYPYIVGPIPRKAVVQRL
jgi:hypothetical protein